MGDHTTRVTFEGDSSSYEDAANRAKKATEGLGDAHKRAKKATDDHSDSSGRAKKATDGFGGAAKKAADPLLELSKNATRSGASMLQLGQQVFNVAKAFGPWGIAIAIAGDLLLGLVDSTNQANKAAKDFAKTRDEERRKDQEEYTAKQSTLFFGKLYEDQKRKATEVIDQNIAKIEEEIAVTRAWGEDTYEAERALAALNAERFRALKGAEAFTISTLEEKEARKANLEQMALEVEWNQKLRDIEAKIAEDRRQATKIKVGGAPRGGGRRTAARGTKENDAMFGQSLGFGGFSGNVVAASEERRIAAEEARVGAVSVGSGRTDAQKTANDAIYATNARLRALDVERATTGETIGLINAEETARRSLLQTQIEAATTFAERSMLQQEQQQVAHDATMARIALEKQAEEERLATITKATSVGTNAANQTVASVLSITDARRGAINAAKAQGKTDREAARAGKIAALEATAGQLQALRNLAITKAIEQTALGIGALASTWGIPNPASILHFASAATWGAVGAGAGIGARAVSSRATSMQRSDSLAASGAGGGAGGGGGQTPRSGAMPGAGSPIPGSPSAPTAAVGTGGPNRTTVIQIGEVHSYGTPRREWLRTMQESLAVERQGSRRRRTGSDD